ncbi:MAG: hypothetical protein ACOYJJ_03250 [Anaerovoracaceae bacterium]|jgi:pimeloyl-ACP methyl ester carboxylesterase
MKKTAVFFPGIGYTNDRSLLYYSRRIAEAKGYETIRIAYHDLPFGKKSDDDVMKKAYRMAREQALKQLKKAGIEKSDRVVFVSKSIGTTVAAWIAAKQGLSVQQIFFTPLEKTYKVLRPGEDALAFYGLRDPYTDRDRIFSLSRECGTVLLLFEGANHSLETGDAARDARTVSEIMELLERVLGEDGRLTLRWTAAVWQTRRLLCRSDDVARTLLRPCVDLWLETAEELENASEDDLCKAAAVPLPQPEPFLAEHAAPPEGEEKRIAALLGQTKNELQGIGSEGERVRAVIRTVLAALLPEDEAAAGRGADRLFTLLNG